MKLGRDDEARLKTGTGKRGYGTTMIGQSTYRGRVDLPRTQLIIREFTMYSMV
jgi:hypothetical protein